MMVISIITLCRLYLRNGGGKQMISVTQVCMLWQHKLVAILKDV